MLKKPNRKIIKILEKNGKVFSFKEVDEKERVKNIRCSCFIKEENVIVRGEAWNSSKNNALIMVIDTMTKELKGNSCFELILNLYAFPFNPLIS